MINKKYLWTLLVASACLLSTASCAKDEGPLTPTPTPQQTTPPQGEVVELDLSGEYIAEGGTEARYIGTTSAEGIKVTLSADEVRNPKKIRLHLAQLERPTEVTKAYITPTIAVTAEGKYRFTYKGKVQLQGQGQSFATGTWYISGIYGADTDNKIFSLPEGKHYAFWADGEAPELNLPLVLGWTRLYTKSKPATSTETATQATPSDMATLSPDLGRNFALQYKPDGILLRIRALNGLITPMPIYHVLMETEEFSVGPAKYPNITSVNVADLTGGKAPSRLTATRSASDATTNTTTKFEVKAPIPTKLRFVQPGEAVAQDVYIWLHETDRTYQDGKHTRIWLNANAPNTGSREWNWGNTWPVEKRLVGQNDNGTFRFEDFDAYDIADQGGERKVTNRPLGTLRYRSYGGERAYLLPKRTAAAGYIRGHIYPANVEITSDLILSELFVEKAYEKNSNNPVASYALLEIYNPSLRSIDLSQYGLTRIFTKEETSKRFICPGIDVSRANPGDHMDKALVLPLNPTYGYEKWSPNRLNVKPNGKQWYGNQAYVHSESTEDYEGYNVVYRDYANDLGSQTLTKASKLAPGKTMIILSSKYFNPLYRPTSTTQDGYTEVGTEQVPDIFKQIKAAVGQGYCQYVFSMNNAKDPTANPQSVDAGVMTVGLLDFFSIVKIKPDGKRTFIDSDWLYDWGTMGQENKFLGDVGTYKGYVRKRRLALVGNNAVLFTQDYLNRTKYEVGGANNFSTFGVSEYREYQSDHRYRDDIQTLVDKLKASKIQPKRAQP